MDARTQRYMQRIEKIMLTPTRPSQPTRPSKSPLNCKPHSLHHYIKYELSTQIIHNFIHKHHNSLIAQAFTAIKTSHYRQKERIYKFIPIENRHAASIHVDLPLSGRILYASLKAIVRRQYNQFINRLQQAAKIVQARPTFSPKPTRKVSRDAAGYSVLMRTSTRPQLENYKVISEWIDGNSSVGGNEDKDNDENLRKQMQNKYVLRAMVRSLAFKIRLNISQAFNFIRKKGYKHPRDEQSQSKTQPAQKFTKENQYMKVHSVFKIENSIKTKLLSFLREIKRKANKLKYRASLQTISLEKTFNIFYKLLFKNHHFSFSQIILTENKKKQEILEIKDLLNVEALSRSSKSNQLSSNILSEVEPYNPIIKLNFYEFIDRIYKLILVVSKLLIPMKEAFVKIDHYASFAYRLEESIKIAPQRYLFEAFQQLKHHSPNKKEEINSISEQQSKGQILYERLNSVIEYKLIEGFTHIKMTTRRARKNQTQEQMSIIEQAKQFISRRIEYNHHTYQNWSELRSIVLSSADSHLNPKRSSILP